MTSALAEQICKRDGTFRSSSISWRWSCSRTPKISIKLPDWLWFFPFIWPRAKSPGEKGLFGLSVCVFHVALSAAALFDFLFSRHSGASAFRCRRGLGASPSAPKNQPNTLLWNSSHATFTACESNVWWTAPLVGDVFWWRWPVQVAPAIQDTPFCKRLFDRETQ